MMKVVHISTSVTGGAGIAAYRLHQQLLKSGLCESLFVCLNADTYRGDADIIEVKKRPFTIVERLRRKLNLPASKNEKFKKQLSKLPGKYEIATWPETSYEVEMQPEVLAADIIHLHWVADFVNYPTFFKKLTGKKLIWTLHDMNPFMGIFHYKGDQERNPILKRLDDKAFKIKEACFKGVNIQIVALSNWIAGEAQKNPVFRRFHYNNIPNGVDCSVFVPQNKSIVQKSIGITSDEHVLLFISENIDNYRKGIDILLEALAMVHLAKPIRVISVGKGNLQLPSHIIYTSLGVLNNEKKLAQAYACASFFITPAREDNLPNVMLEAFACGIPVVSFPIGGLKEHVIPFKTGILADELSVPAFAKAIELCLNEKSNFDFVGIRNYAKEKFSHKLQIDNISSLYQQLLSNQLIKA